MEPASSADLRDGRRRRDSLLVAGESGHSASCNLRLARRDPARTEGPLGPEAVAMAASAGTGPSMMATPDLTWSLPRDLDVRVRARIGLMREEEMVRRI